MEWWKRYSEPLLKEELSGFTHQSVFTGLEEYQYCIGEMSCVKSFVAPEGAEWNVMGCIVWVQRLKVGKKKKANIA